MRNDEPPDANQLSNGISDPATPEQRNGKNKETVEGSSGTSTRMHLPMMAFHQEATRDGAQPFSGSPKSEGTPKDTTTVVWTDTNLHPIQSTTVPGHLDNHIRTNSEVLTGSPKFQATAERAERAERESDVRLLHLSEEATYSRQSADQVPIDKRKVSPLDIASDMSIGDRNLTLDSNVSGAGDSSRTGQMLDDNSESASKGGRRKRSLKLSDDQTAGRWTPEEHQDFLEGLKIFGREWKKVAEKIPTRTSAQIRSHAQKYFAKIARDETIILQDQASAAVAPQQQASSCATVPETAFQVSSSVQRSVNRILANPNSVETEVEDTLRELRERYFQLQIRLEETNQRQNGAPPPRQRGRLVENEDRQLPDIPSQPRLVVDKRKRVLEEWSDGIAQRHHPDDMSSISSAGFSPTRELGNEELIALSVLGGSLLPHSASYENLQQAASAEENSNQEQSRHSRKSSPSSTIGSNHEALEDADEKSDQSKKRKLSDEEDGAANNDTNAEEGDPSNRDGMVL